MFASCRDSSNDGQGDTVSLGMSVGELDDSGEGKGKKKRGRPGKQGVRSPLLIASGCLQMMYKAIFLMRFCFLQRGLVRRLESPRLIKVGGDKMEWPIRMERGQKQARSLRWSNKAKVLCR